MDSSDSGIIGSEKDESEPDLEYKELARQIVDKKVLIEEVWQEAINPLVSQDAVFDEDLELFQYYGNEALIKQSGKEKDLAKEDRANFQAAKKEIVHKAKPTLKIKKHAESKPSFMDKFRGRIKIKKK